MIVLRKRTGVVAFLVQLALGTGGCVIDISDINVDDDWDNGTVKVSTSFSRTVPVQGQSGITLTGTNGTVVVDGQTRAGQVIIQARRWVRADTRREAEEYLPRVRVVVGVDPGEVEVRTEQPGEAGGRTYGVDYEIRVPADFRVHITNGNGLVEIRYVREDVWVENGNGDVVLEGHRGGSWVSLGNGEIRADVLLPWGGQVVHAVGNGGVKLAVQTDVSAVFSAHVGNGVISVTGLEFTEWVSGPRFAEGTLGDGDGLIDLSVGNGWIQAEGN
jgi:hypothetical protein